VRKVEREKEREGGGEEMKSGSESEGGGEERGRTNRCQTKIKEEEMRTH
jgi:hypothetical protein